MDGPPPDLEVDHFISIAQVRLTGLQLRDTLTQESSAISLRIAPTSRYF